jgi:hypothetical protein
MLDPQLAEHLTEQSNIIKFVRQWMLTDSEPEYEKALLGVTGTCEPAISSCPDAARYSFDREEQK